MYLVDSDYLVDGLIGVPHATQLLERLSGHGLGVSVVSYGEIFEGAFGDPDPAPRLARFRAFLARFPIVPLSDPVMEVFARLRKDLRDRGQLIPDFDLVIAATALHHDLELVTRNLRHFNRIPDLTIYQPS